jgi:hypothetical protein
MYLTDPVTVVHSNKSPWTARTPSTTLHAAQHSSGQIFVHGHVSGPILSWFGLPRAFMLVSCLASSALKMEVICSSKMSVHFPPTAQRYSHIFGPVYPTIEWGGWVTRRLCKGEGISSHRTRVFLVLCPPEILRIRVVCCVLFTVCLEGKEVFQHTYSKNWMLTYAEFDMFTVLISLNKTYSKTSLIQTNWERTLVQITESPENLLHNN